MVFRPAILVQSGVPEAPSLLRIDVHQAGLRAVTGRPPVSHTAHRGMHQDTAGLRLFVRVGDRLSLRVESTGPVRRHELRCDEVFAGRAVQDEEVAVAAGVRQQLAGLAGDGRVEQYGRLHGVPIMRVMRRRLVEPLDLAGVGVNREDGAGVQVGSLAHIAGQHRVRVAGAPVHQVQRWIVGAGQPDGTAALGHRFGAGPCLRPGLAGLGDGVQPPQYFAGVGIERVHRMGHVRHIAGGAEADLVLDHERGGRDVIAVGH